MNVSRKEKMKEAKVLTKFRRIYFSLKWFYSFVFKSMKNTKKQEKKFLKRPNKVLQQELKILNAKLWKAKLDGV